MQPVERPHAHSARSWLYVPGHRSRLHHNAFCRGADVVVLDLEDAVPPSEKDNARKQAAATMRLNRAWVRVNRSRTDACARDIEAIGPGAAGIVLPKVESPEDVEWVRKRLPHVPIDCLVETARGCLAAPEIALTAGVSGLTFGAADLSADLGVEDSLLPLYRARARLVLAARGAGLDGPTDAAYTSLRDTMGLQSAARHARQLGFSGKLALHPGQVGIINIVFTPTERELEWARKVVAALEASNGNPVTLDTGEFVDFPVAERARRLLERGLASAHRLEDRPKR